MRGTPHRKGAGPGLVDAGNTAVSHDYPAHMPGVTLSRCDPSLGRTHPCSAGRGRVGCPEGKVRLMTNLIVKLRARLATRDRGATAVEYGLIVALIAAIIVAVVASLGTEINDTFESVCTAINAGVACP